MRQEIFEILLKFGVIGQNEIASALNFIEKQSKQLSQKVKPVPLTITSKFAAEEIARVKEEQKDIIEDANKYASIISKAANTSKLLAELKRRIKEDVKATTGETIKEGEELKKIREVQKDVREKIKDQERIKKEINSMIRHWWVLGGRYRDSLLEQRKELIENIRKHKEINRNINEFFKLKKQLPLLEKEALKATKEFAQSVNQIRENEEKVARIKATFQAAKAYDNLRRNAHLFLRTIGRTLSPLERSKRLLTMYTNTAKKVQDVPPIYNKVRRATELLTERVQRLTEAHARQNSALRKLISRIFLWAGAWTMGYRIVRKVLNIIPSLVNWFRELDEQIARAMSVTRAYGRVLETQKLFYSAIASVTSEFSISQKEAAEALYYLGSAGLSVKEQLRGLRPIVALATATFGDLQTVAKLVAGAYNVFGDRIRQTVGRGKEFQRIADVLAHTYSRHQVELQELAEGYRYVAGVSGLLEVSFADLTATIGFLNTRFLRGTRAGTSLANAFVQMAKKTDMLRDRLGIVFSLNLPLNFISTMKLLHNELGEVSKTVYGLRLLMDIFGMRGGRSIALVLSNFKEWEKEVDIIRNTQRGFVNEMAQGIERVTRRQLRILLNNIRNNLLPIIKQADKWTNDFIATLNRKFKVDSLVIGGKQLVETFAKLREIESPLFAEGPLDPFKSVQGRLLQILGLIRKINPALAEELLIVETQNQEIKKRLSLMGTLNTIYEALTENDILRLKQASEQIRVLMRQIDKGTVLYTISMKLLEIFNKMAKEEEERLKLSLDNLQKLVLTKKEQREVADFMFKYNLYLEKARSSFKGVIEDLKVQVSLFDRTLEYLISQREIQKETLGDNKEQRSILDEEIRHLNTIKTLLHLLLTAGKDRAKIAEEIIVRGKKVLHDTEDYKKLENIVNSVLQKRIDIQKEITEEQTRHHYALKEALLSFSDETKLLLNIEKIQGTIADKEEQRKDILKAINSYIEDQVKLARNIAKEIESSMVNAFISIKKWGDQSNEVFCNLFDSVGKMIEEKIIQKIVDISLEPLFQSLTRGILRTTMAIIPSIPEVKQPVVGLEKIASANKLFLDKYSEIVKASINSIQKTKDIMIEGAKKAPLASKNLWFTVFALSGAIAAKSFAKEVNARRAESGFYLGMTIAQAFGAGPIVTALASIAGAITGYNLPVHKTEQNTKETAEAVKEISPQLEISNKQLELVNRNLIAIRQELKPWIMPESFYFRTQPLMFQTEGVVPGQPRFAIVHGQEKILPLGVSPVRVDNIIINVREGATAEEIVQAISDAFAVDSIRGYQK